MKVSNSIPHSRISRRNAICLGGLTAFGLGLPKILAARAANASPQDKCCILLWLEGGPSHLEMFDPKPDAPVEVRGPMDSISTTIPGVRLNECLSQTANIMEEVALVRSVTSPLGEHNFGTHYLLTGYQPTPALEYPAICSTVSQIRDQRGVLPPNIAIPRFSNNITANGFLSASTQPFAVGGNPQRPDFKVRDLDYYHGLDLARLNRRKKIVNAFDQFASKKDASVNGLDPDLERAFSLLASDDAKAAFDLTDEPQEIRNRYGMSDPIGQSCLLARRLVQRGVPFVTVNSPGWDTHNNIDTLKKRFATDRNAKLPSFDKAFSALITDLKEKGMLQDTLVLVMGEFGRTPTINSNGGRDHWPRVAMAILAGGGMVPGQVIGATDRYAGEPTDRPIHYQDVLATVYHNLGINARHTTLTDTTGRPQYLLDKGSPIRELVG